MTHLDDGTLCERRDNPRPPVEGAAQTQQAQNGISWHVQAAQPDSDESRGARIPNSCEEKGEPLRACGCHLLRPVAVALTVAQIEELATVDPLPMTGSS